MADTLMKRALAHKSKNRGQGTATEDEMELGIAWAQGKVRSSQVAAALGQRSGSATTYTSLAIFLRAAVQAGKLVVPHA